MSGEGSCGSCAWREEWWEHSLKGGHSLKEFTARKAAPSAGAEGRRFLGGNAVCSGPGKTGRPEAAEKGRAFGTKGVCNPADRTRPSVSCKPPMDRAAQSRQLLRVPFHFPAGSEAVQRAEIDDLPSITQAAKGNSRTSP